MPKTLDQVGTAFDKWRTTRPKRSQTPQELILQALGLLEQHSKAEITSRLDITYTMIHRWMEKHVAEETFVVLPHSTMEPVICNNDSQLEVSIKLSGGSELTLVGPHTEAAAFVSNLQNRGVL